MIGRLFAVAPSLVYAFAFVASACVGSFINVVIARLPAGESLVWPSSRCPKCKAAIAWYDNLPIVSWIALRGRCRRCRERISPRYLAVELIVGLLGVALVHRFGPGVEALGYFAFTAGLVALAYIDLATWLLPHEITWPLLGLGLLSPLWTGMRWSESSIGAAAGLAAFAAIAFFGEKVLKKEAMGWGDVWLLGGIGAWLGWPALLPVVMLSALQGVIVGFALLKARRGQDPSPPVPTPQADTQDEEWVPPPTAVPFGPFLALAALEHLFFGAALSRAYHALLSRLWA